MSIMFSCLSRCLACVSRLHDDVWFDDEEEQYVVAGGVANDAECEVDDDADEDEDHDSDAPGPQSRNVSALPDLSRLFRIYWQLFRIYRSTPQLRAVDWQRLNDQPRSCGLQIHSRRLAFWRKVHGLSMRRPNLNPAVAGRLESLCRMRALCLEVHGYDPHIVNFDQIPYHYK